MFQNIKHKDKPLTIILDLGQANRTCGGVKLVQCVPYPPQRLVRGKIKDQERHDRRNAKFINIFVRMRSVINNSTIKNQFLCLDYMVDLVSFVDKFVKRNSVIQGIIFKFVRFICNVPLPSQNFTFTSVFCIKSF